MYMYSYCTPRNFCFSSRQFQLDELKQRCDNMGRQMKCLEENSKQQFQKMSEWMECAEKKCTQQFEKISVKFDKLFNMMEESSLTASPSACPRWSEQSHLPSPSPTRTCTSLSLTYPTCTVQQPLQPIFQNMGLLSLSCLVLSQLLIKSSFLEYVVTATLMKILRLIWYESFFPRRIGWDAMLLGSAVKGS